MASGFPQAPVNGHRPLSRMIHEWLREAILSGALPPGQVLRQHDLANRFSASRVPLREALSHLEAEGLVVLRPRRGYAVASLETHELLEILQLRMIVEEHAGYVACRARTGADVTRLAACLNKMDKLAVKRPTPEQLAAFAALNQEFHDILISASGREHLRQISANLRAKLERYIRLEVAMTQQFEEAHNDHHAIFDAFEAGDAGEVARLSREHCERTALRFVRGLQENGIAADLTPAEVIDTGLGAGRGRPRSARPRQASGEAPQRRRQSSKDINRETINAKA